MPYFIYKPRFNRLAVEHCFCQTKSASDDAYLLPLLDEYTVAYKDRSDLVELRYVEAINASSRGGLLGPVIVIGGRAVGAWKRTLKKDKVIIETTLVAPLNADEEKAIALAAQRFGTFVGLPVEY